jgi:hypothetical protein
MPEPMHRSEEDTRAGSTPHIVRYVLAISLLLAIVALSAVWMTGALKAPEPVVNGSGVPASQQAQP